MKVVHSKQKDMHLKLKSKEEKLEGTSKGTINNKKLDKHKVCFLYKLTVQGKN